MIEPYYIIIFSTISGSISYLIWKIFEKILSKKRKFKYLYHMLLLVAAFYLIPFFYLVIRALIILSERNLKKELLYLWTPRIAEIRTILAFVWLCGLVWGIQGGFHKLKGMLKLRVMNVLPAENELVQLKNRIVEELNIHQKVEVCRSYSVISPMVIGIWKKTVYIPVADYKQNEIEILLYHELTHVKQHITGLKNFVVLLQVFQWFNPCVYVLMGALDEWSETLCDLSVYYDTKCNATIKEYFEFAMQEAEKEQAMLSGFLTKLQRLKGLSARFEKIRTYSKDKELTCFRGMIMILLFLVISSTSFLIMGAGFTQVHNSLYNATEVKTKLQVNEDNYTEYKVQVSLEDNEKMKEMSVLQQNDNSLAFNNNVELGELLVSSTFEVDKGNKIKVMASIIPNDVDLKVGVITPNKTKIYIDGRNMFSYSYIATEKGKYIVFVENETSKVATIESLISYGE